MDNAGDKSPKQGKRRRLRRRFQRIRLMFGLAALLATGCIAANVLHLYDFGMDANQVWSALGAVGMLLLGVLSTFSLEGIIGQSERYRD